MRLRLRCGAVYKLGDLQWCMVHVPDSVLTIKDFAGHVARLLELNLHGGNAEPPQILLDGFLVPHDEEVREVLRDDEVIDVEPAEPSMANGSLSAKRQAQASLEGPGKRPKVAPVMALGWQPQSNAVPDAEDSKPKSKGAAASPVNGHREVQSKAIDKAKALALATCESTPVSKEEGRGIFVGGLPSSVDDKELRKHFETYGTVQDATVVLNQRTGKPKGFGFVEFRDAGVREAVMEKSIQIPGKVVEVKVRQARAAKGGGKDGKGKDSKDAGKAAGKDGKGGKSGKGKGKVESKAAPKIRQTQPADDSDSDDEEDEEEEASTAVKQKDEEEAMTEEMKQMAALGLPVSFTASEQQGGNESDDDEDEDEDDE